MRRRAFLVFLASSLTTVFGTVHASRATRGCTAVAHNRHGVVLHKGWILRSDDPRE